MESQNKTTRMNKDDVLKEINEKDTKVVEDVCNILAQYDKDIRLCLEKIVCALCNVKQEKLWGRTRDMTIVQARWFYWYAYRFISNDSHQSIAHIQERKFATSCVGQSITKMSMLISSDTVWSKRWIILKQILKEAFKYEEKA